MWCYRNLKIGQSGIGLCPIKIIGQDYLFTPLYVISKHNAAAIDSRLQMRP